MPLWTILTKWPAPCGPQCRKPCSARGRRRRSRPGVRGAASTPGASAAKIGVRRSTIVGLAADHQAVAALQAGDAAAGADVDVVDGSARGEPRRAADVVAVVGVAAVDDDVAGLESAAPGRRARGRRRRPAPSARSRAAPSASRRDRRARPRRRRRLPASRDGGRVHVVDDALVAVFSSRRTMFAPMRPRPIIPSCMVILRLGVWSARRRRRAVVARRESSAGLGWETHR